MALEKRFNSPSLWHVFLCYLKSIGYPVPVVPESDINLSTQPSETVQQVLIEIYHSIPSLAQLCELMVDLDEGIQEWRYRHVKMVERTIGSKTGTGGSPGVEYLKSSLFKPLFPDLWLIRSEFKT
jgi:tryptophan 2,3-dioxygenase